MPMYNLLGPLLKTGLSLIENVLESLAKSVLIPLGLTGAASATDERMFRSSTRPSDLAKKTTLEQLKTQLEQVKVQLELVEFFKAASPFNKV